MIDVALRVFSSSDKTVLNNSRVHLYAGSKEALCKVILLDRDALGAGETCYAQLRLEEPMALNRGDRFIIRFYSPIITIGGGLILDSVPDKHKRNKPDILKSLEILETGSLADIMEQKCSQRRFPKNDELALELGILRTQAAELVKEEIAAGKLVMLSEGSILSTSKLERLKSNIEYMINAYHEENPLSDGIPKQELLSKLMASYHIEDEKLLAALVNYLIEIKVISDQGKTIARAGFEVQHTEEHEALKKELTEKYRAAGIEVIKNDEVYSLADKNTVAAMLVELAEEGIIRKMDSAYYISAEGWNQALNAVTSFGADFTLAEFRDKLGTTRKYAEILLAALDRAGITRFNGKTRTALIAR